MEQSGDITLPVKYYPKNLSKFSSAQVSLKSDHLILQILKSKDGPVESTLFDAPISALTYDESANRMTGRYTIFTYNSQTYMVTWNKNPKKLIQQMKQMGIKSGKTQHVGPVGVTLLIVFVLVIIAVIVLALVHAAKS